MSAHLHRVVLITVVLASACGGDDDTTESIGDASASTTQSTSASGSESEGSGSTSATMTASTSASSSATDTTDSTSASTSDTADSGSSTAASSDGSSSSGIGSDSSSDSGHVCSMQRESCANGELCCDGLICCAGVPVPPGQEYCGMDCPDSDRNIKEGFAAVDADAVLDKVATLPITSWSYKAEGPQVRHIGPMAQDFKAAFEVGSTDKAIAKVDADGVALAAIQGVLHRVRDLERENAELRERLAKLERALGN